MLILLCIPIILVFLPVQLIWFIISPLLFGIWIYLDLIKWAKGRGKLEVNWNHISELVFIFYFIFKEEFLEK